MPVTTRCYTLCSFCQLPAKLVHIRRALSSTTINSHQETVSGQACKPPDPHRYISFFFSCSMILHPCWSSSISFNVWKMPWYLKVAPFSYLMGGNVFNACAVRVLFLFFLFYFVFGIHTSKNLRSFGVEFSCGAGVGGYCYCSQNEPKQGRSLHPCQEEVHLILF